MSEKRRPVCPQCGGYRIKHRWVKKEPIPKFRDISFDEHAEDLKKQLGWIIVQGGDLHFPKLADHSQLVIECEDCGFTKVFEIKEGGE